MNRLWHRLFGRERSIMPGVVAGTLATLLGTAALIVAFLWAPTSSDPVADSGPAPGASSADGGHPAGSAQQAPTGSASASPAPTASPTRPVPGTTGATLPRTDPAPVPLTAAFASQEAGLAGYSATVTLRNPGQATVDGWTVVVTLPRSTLNVTDVQGATATRDGAVWTFRPAGNAQVTGGAAVTVAFRVNGAAIFDARPTGCTVDGRPCEGL